jgi:hypothetical protein
MAAKTIEVSTDDVTYLVLPGSTGGMDPTAEGIDDTIFGQTFQSQEAGLIGWTISAQALFKGYAGYNATIKKHGTSTSMTTEAMTLVSGKTYQIDAAAKQIWDRATAITVFDNAVDHTADVASIDWLFGKVTFDSAYTVTGPVTITGNYFPTVALALANSFTLTQTAEAIDTSNLASAAANGGHFTFDPGLRTVTAELTGTFDATGAFRTELKSRTEFVVEIDPVGQGESLCRGFFRLVGAATDGDVGALEEETLNFALNVPIASATNNFAVDLPFGWFHSTSPASEIPAAVKLLLDNWESETKIFGRYLPQGATGQSPLDGAKGQVVITDVTLNGGVSEMNEFAATLQGDGAYTVV